MRSRLARDRSSLEGKPLTRPQVPSPGRRPASRPVFSCLSCPGRRTSPARLRQPPATRGRAPSTAARPAASPSPAPCGRVAARSAARYSLPSEVTSKRAGGVLPQCATVVPSGEYNQSFVGVRRCAASALRPGSASFSTRTLIASVELEGVATVGGIDAGRFGRRTRRAPAHSGQAGMDSARGGDPRERPQDAARTTRSGSASSCA